jgi:hypothetical protein
MSARTGSNCSSRGAYELVDSESGFGVYRHVGIVRRRLRAWPAADLGELHEESFTHESMPRLRQPDRSA